MTDHPKWCYASDDLLQGAPEELDLGSDEDGEIELFPKAKQKQKAEERRVKIVSPPGSDDASSLDDENSEEGEEERVTMANMEARSHALDEAAAREAELDLEEMQNAVAAQGDDDEDIEADGDEEGDEPFRLPTAEEREEEQKSVPDVHFVQRRMRWCVRILSNFKKLAEKERYVWTIFLVTRVLSCVYRSRSEYLEQLTTDIASYFGYNQFLAEKLLQLFSVAEVPLSL